MDVNGSILTFIRSEFDTAVADFELRDDTALIESGIVDSLGIMKLLQYLEDSFSIRISDDELRPENFETPGAIASLVATKMSSR